jgi:antitoxin ParD1/3/4
MSKVEKRTFSITTQQAEFIDRKVAEGVYASGSEIIREGLRAIKAREERIERWIVEEIIPAYEEWKANPDDVYTTEEVFDAVDRAIDEAAKKAS